jgi:hypothetical protein
MIKILLSTIKHRNPLAGRVLNASIRKPAAEHKPPNKNPRLISEYLEERTPKKANRL